MTKDEFNKLEIIEQINYLNKYLRDGYTLTSLCKNIGIARSTVGGRATKLGYIFDKEINQYILENPNSNARAYSKLTVSNMLTNKNNINDLGPKNDITTKEISPVSNELTSSNNSPNGLILSDTDSDNLSYLLKNINVLKDLIEGNKGSTTTNEFNCVDDIINDIYRFKQEKRNYKVKSLRIDSDILGEFEAIANDLSSKGINQQEFLNYILKSYIDFFKNIKE